MKIFISLLSGIVLGFAGYHAYGLAMASNIKSDFDAQLAEYCKNLNNK